MKKLLFIVLLCLFLIQTSFSQTKVITGDTAYWYRRNIDLQRELALKDFEQSSDELNFRFWSFGQVIEISKDSVGYGGHIINYIYHTRRRKKKSETLISKITLSKKLAEDVFNIVQNIGILNLPSDKNIKEWKHGFDGITYIIEHADKHIYSFKNYWTPSAQDSIPEALIVLSLIKDLSDTLKLSEAYTIFQNNLLKKGCYSTGGSTSMCYSRNSFNFGYSGAAKLPLGFYFSYYPSYFGKLKMDAGAAIEYNLNNNGFYHLKIDALKWNLFKKTTNFSDFLAYNYQNRRLNFNGTKLKFENHQIKYGLNLKRNFSVGIGLDYLNDNKDRIGAILYASKWIPDVDISTNFSFSAFQKQLNYKAEIFKSFYFNYNFPINSISIGLAYEDFMNYKDIYFSARVQL